MDFYERKCPDCQSSMSPIQIVDDTVEGIGLGSFNLARRKGLEYVGPDAKAGDVVALMCNRCARIILFGRPK